MTSCVKCGKELADELFCTNCGQRTSSKSATASNTPSVISQDVGNEITLRRGGI